MMKTTKLALLFVLIGAFALNLGVAAKYGLSKPMTSDAAYYLDAARHLAEGHGFYIGETFWPDAPATSRLPGWPFVASLALRIAGSSPGDAAMRITSAVINAGVAGIIFLLAFHLVQRRLPATLAAGVYMLNPTALYLMCTGESEPLFLLLAGSGVLLLLGSGMTVTLSWTRLGAAALLGCACLVRANFVLLLPFIVVYGLVRARRELRLSTRVWQSLILAGVFILPAAGWIVRNQQVTGVFPVLSTLKGQTFYGGNNVVVADSLDMWGYWIFPDGIPGATPMRTLAETMTEVEVDQHYTKLGLEFVRSHAPEMPRLILGKLIRSYVPVPWKPSLGTWAVSGYRWLLYGAVVAVFLVRRRPISTSYLYWTASMFCVNAITVCTFWGCSRFAFQFEPFLIPLTAMLVLGSSLKK